MFNYMGHFIPLSNSVVSVVLEWTWAKTWVL